MKLSGFFLALVLSGGHAAAQHLNQTFQMTTCADFKWYGWKEFGDINEELLNEDGMLYGFGLIPRVAFGDTKKFYLESETTVHFGKVDYDGFLQNQFGQRTPYSTKTVYRGFETAATAGYIFSLSDQFDLTPTVSFGYEYWKRDLDDGGPNGYDERYKALLVHIGIEGTILLNRHIQFLSAVSMRIPVSISETIDLASRNQGGPADISLSPGVSPRIRIGGGVSIYRVLIEVSFETWTLTKSDEDKGYHQPESTRKIFFVRLGYTI